MTSAPSSAALRAHAVPAWPAPSTAMSVSSVSAMSDAAISGSSPSHVPPMTWPIVLPSLPVNVMPVPGAAAEAAFFSPSAEDEAPGASAARALPARAPAATAAPAAATKPRRVRHSGSAMAPRIFPSLSAS